MEQEREDEDLEEFMLRTRPPTHFTADRLRRGAIRSWAVVSHPSGMIAEDDEGEPLMRLNEFEASVLAASMSAGLYYSKPG
jgi:hypothetical protein